MQIYTFHLCNASGGSPTFEALDLANDGATFTIAGQLLDEHLSCDPAEVWRGGAVLARHRDQPVIRPIPEAV